MTQSDTGDPHVSAEQFEALFRSLTVWGKWGEEDERGALRYLPLSAWRQPHGSCARA